MRDRILVATERIARERGPAATTTRAIARAAGCSEGSLYRYFPTKTALVQACLDRPAGEVTDALDRLLAGAGRRAIAGPVGDTLLIVADHLRDRLPLATLLPPATGPTGLTGLLDPVATGLTRYLRAEQRHGRVRRAVDADAVARTLATLALGWATGGAPPRRTVDRAIRAVVDGLRPRGPGR